MPKLHHETFETDFLIYQMGKVGSSSVAFTLQEAGARTLQTHSHKEAKAFIDDSKKKIHIICGVREPLSRNISAFFSKYRQ